MEETVNWMDLASEARRTAAEFEAVGEVDLAKAERERAERYDRLARERT